MLNLVRRLLADTLDIDADLPPPAEAVDEFPPSLCARERAAILPVSGACAKAWRDCSTGFAPRRGDQQTGEFTRSLLARSGLAAGFSVVVGGDALPRGKPDPMPLVWACGRLGVSPAEGAVHRRIRSTTLPPRAPPAARCSSFPYGYNEGRDVQELDCDAIVPTVESAVKTHQALPISNAIHANHFTRICSLSPHSGRRRGPWRPCQ